MDVAGKSTKAIGEASNVTGRAKRLVSMTSYPHSNKFAKVFVFSKEDLPALNATKPNSEDVKAVASEDMASIAIQISDIRISVVIGRAIKIAASEVIQADGEDTKVSVGAYLATGEDKPGVLAAVISSRTQSQVVSKMKI